MVAVVNTLVISIYLLFKERELRENVDEKRSRNLAELSLLTDKEKELQFDLRHTQDALREEKNRSERLLDQVSWCIHITPDS